MTKTDSLHEIISTFIKPLITPAIPHDTLSPKVKLRGRLKAENIRGHL